MPAQAGIQPACVSLAAFGLGPSLRWGDGFLLFQFLVPDLLHLLFEFAEQRFAFAFFQRDAFRGVWRNVHACIGKNHQLFVTELAARQDRMGEL